MEGSRSRLRRRSATAAGLYTSVALGLLGMVVAARELGKEDFGLFTTVVFAAGLFESLLDLTVEESLTKFGFRYIAGEDWGRLRRLLARGRCFVLLCGRVRAVRGGRLCGGVG